VAIRAFGNIKARPVSPGQITRAVAEPMLWLAAALAVGLLVWLVLRVVRPQARGLGLALLMCLAVGLALPSRPWPEWRNAADAVTGAPRKIPVPAVPMFTTDEIQAALWLERNAGRYDVVVTNTACLRLGSAPVCDARGFLVSGVGGHRTLMEGWAYTQQSLANQGKRNVRYSELPSPWPDRVQLTTKALTAPTTDVLENLRRDYGVRWVFADKRAGRVAEGTLDQLADRRYTRGQVIVYELRN
jgi:hypothetical protein